MKKIKILVVLLAMCTLLSVLASCNGGDTADTTGQIVAEPTEAPTEEPATERPTEAEVTEREDTEYDPEIISLPAIENDEVYVGQYLSDILLVGGEGNVPGTFAWQNPNIVVREIGEYQVAFIPDADDYSIVYGTITIEPKQLTVTVNVGSNGSANILGTVDVNYGSDLKLSFKGDIGYKLDKLTVDGADVAADAKYTVKNITESHTVNATFAESGETFTVTCLEGSDGCYTVSGSTLTFTELSTDSVYIISGVITGNIVIDVGDTYRLDLEMHGFTIKCDYTSPISIISGDEVTLTAKNGFENFVYDLRPMIPAEDTTTNKSAIHSEIDLDIGGKGSLIVKSSNNNGIGTKDDLKIKNLNLTVECNDNALKGNDSVTIESGNLTLTAKAGDGIKTKNTDISSKGKQRGIVTITSGTVVITAAKECINAAHSTLINEIASNVTLQKYN